MQGELFLLASLYYCALHKEYTSVVLSNQLIHLWLERQNKGQKTLPFHVYRVVPSFVVVVVLVVIYTVCMLCMYSMCL